MSRRLPLCAGVALALLVIAGCSSATEPSASPTTAAGANPTGGIDAAGTAVAVQPGDERFAEDPGAQRRGGGSAERPASYEVHLAPDPRPDAAASWKDLFILGPDLRWSPIGLGDVAAVDPHPEKAFPNVDIHFGGIGSGHSFSVKVWDAPGVDQGEAIALMGTLLDRI